MISWAKSPTTHQTAPTGPRGPSCSTSLPSAPASVTICDSTSRSVSAPSHLEAPTPWKGGVEKTRKRGERPGKKTREGKKKKGRSQLTGPSLDANLSTTLINEFPCRPHWTKNTRDIFTQALKNLDQDVSLKSATKHATPFHPPPPPGYFHFSRHPCCIHSNVFHKSPIKSS